MNRKIERFLLSVLVLLGLIIIPSCDTNQEVIPVESDSEFTVHISAIDGKEKINLAGFVFPLTVLPEDESWVNYEIFEDGEGCVLTILSKNSEPNMSRQQMVSISDKNGRKATIKLIQGVYVASKDNAVNEAFLKNWEEQDTVMIYSEKQFMKVRTPWTRHSLVTTLPESIRYDVRSQDGWEMAFSLLGLSDMDGTNYFGLYNKYTGTLRIFYYVDNAFTTGSEYCFEVDLGSKVANIKYPYYNALQYSIPTSHANLNLNIDLMNTGTQMTTFKTFVTPYSTSTSTALQKGWTAFDLDASGFCPSDVDYKNSKEQLVISIRSTQKSLMDLCGGLTADIKGNFSQVEETEVSSASGLTKTLKQMGKYGSAASKPVGTVVKALTGTDISGVISGVSSVCTFLSGLSSKYIDEAETKVDSMAGRIELGLTGKIDLSGKITAMASNNCPPVTLANIDMISSNYGKGVWGLKEDPVIYIATDRILGDVRRFNLTCMGDKSYFVGAIDPKTYNLRMISYLDPASIKLNINSSIFKSIEELEVIDVNFGAFPEEKAGHTSGYKTLLGINQPTLQISEGKKGDTWKSFTDSNKMKYTQLKGSDVLSSEIGETEQNCQIYSQKGSNISYYGRLENEMGKPFILNPQILLPYSVSDGGDVTLFDGAVPDLYATVTIRFKSEGNVYVMSQRFIPQVKLATDAQVKQHYQVCKKMQQATKKGYTINGFLLKDHAVKVLTERFVKIMDGVEAAK